MANGADSVLETLRNHLLWDRAPGDMLGGCMMKYRATEIKAYRTAVLLYMYPRISVVGQYVVQPGARDIWADICNGFGCALLFSLDETGDERFKTAAEALMDDLFPGHSSEGAPLDMPLSDLVQFSPFIAAYDNRFGNKQTYKEISRRFARVWEESFCAEEGLFRLALPLPGPRSPFTADGMMLTALIDTLEQLDPQLYEHYRVLADQFLAAARGLMRYRDEGGALRAMVDAGDDKASAKILYALKKGVRLGLLDEERYLPVIEKTYEAWQELMLENTIEWDLEGACMMADVEMKMGEEGRK